MLKPFLNPLPLNTRAPAFGRLDQHSQTVYSEELIRQGGYLLHFYFAPWSNASQQSLLALKKLAPALAGKNIAIVASNPYDWQIQHELATQLALPFSLLYDPIAKTAKAYKAVLLNTFFNHEVSYFVSAKGCIDYVRKGPANEQALFEGINAVIQQTSAGQRLT